VVVEVEQAFTESASVMAERSGEISALAWAEPQVFLVKKHSQGPEFSQVMPVKTPVSWHCRQRGLPPGTRTQLYVQAEATPRFMRNATRSRPPAVRETLALFFIFSSFEGR
jgi:hypothetical protein